MIKSRRLSTLLDIGITIVALGEILSGIRYPARPFMIWLRHYLPDIFQVSGADLRDGLKMMVGARLFRPTDLDNSHQYAHLIGEIHDAEQPDLAGTIIQCLRIRYGIVNRQGPHLDLMEAWVRQEVQRLSARARGN